MRKARAAEDDLPILGGIGRMANVQEGGGWLGKRAAELAGEVRKGRWTEGRLVRIRS